MAEGSEHHVVSDDVLSAISNGLVEIHRNSYGGEPTGATTFAQDGVVICKVEGGLARVEKTLLERGEGEAVRKVRVIAQDAASAACKKVVEDATGRRVSAHMSATDSSADLSFELFVMDGTKPEGPPKAGR